MKNSYDDQMYCLTVNEDDILPMLDKLIRRLCYEYNEENQRYVFGFALGPNAYKSYEVAYDKRGNALRSVNWVNADTRLYRGYQILASPHPGIIPLFKHDGWIFVHAEAKKFVDKEGLN